MVAIRLSAVVDQDGELRVKVPDSIAPGPVELVIESPRATLPPSTNPAREAARAKFAAAGLLSSAHRLPPGAVIPTEAEVRAAGVLPPGARPSEDLINQDRDEA